MGWLPEPTGTAIGFRRPVVVVQGVLLNRSRISTVVRVPAYEQLEMGGRTLETFVFRRASQDCQKNRSPTFPKSLLWINPC